MVRTDNFCVAPLGLRTTGTAICEGAAVLFAGWDEVSRALLVLTLARSRVDAARATRDLGADRTLDALTAAEVARLAAGPAAWTTRSQPSSISLASTRTT